MNISMVRLREDVLFSDEICASLRRQRCTTMAISLAEPRKGKFVVDGICSMTTDMKICGSKELAGKN